MPNRRSNASFSRTTDRTPVLEAIVFKGKLVASNARAASSRIFSMKCAGVCPVAATNLR
jgi:hypothetical protein